MGFADPDAGVAFGYVMNHVIPRWQSSRNRSLIDAVYALPLSPSGPGGRRHSRLAVCRRAREPVMRIIHTSDWHIGRRFDASPWRTTSGRS